MGNVTVTFIGSGDAFGSGGRFQTCIGIRTPDHFFLMDCGPSSLISMRQRGIAPGDVDAIFLTHLHGDHYGGVPFYILDAMFLQRRERPLIITGPPGVEEAVRDTMDRLFKNSVQLCETVFPTFLELPPGGEISVEGATVQGFEMDHPTGYDALSLKVKTAGRAIGFSGDGQWCPGIPAAADGTDLFISECYTYDMDVPYHNNYVTIQAHRDEINTRHLVLTHMSDDMLAKQNESLWTCAEDGLEISL
ncbi:MAG: MBL fold metallo-hydrolase [Magnetospiraceae bacterium]